MTYMAYDIRTLLIILLLTLLIFYFLGSIIKALLDRFEKQNEKASLDNGEVIEKEANSSGVKPDAAAAGAAAAAPVLRPAARTRR